MNYRYSVVPFSQFIDDNTLDTLKYFYIESTVTNVQTAHAYIVKYGKKANEFLKQLENQVDTFDYDDHIDYLKNNKRYDVYEALMRYYKLSCKNFKCSDKELSFTLSYMHLLYNIIFHKKISSPLQEEILRYTANNKMKNNVEYDIVPIVRLFY